MPASTSQAAAVGGTSWTRVSRRSRTENGGDHRQAAFEACAFLMDWLKTKAPFWKCEDTAAGPKWVEARTEDDRAAARWRDE